MTTTTSSPDRFGSFLGGLLRKNRANMVYLFVLGFISLPLQYLVQMFRTYHMDGQRFYSDISAFGETGIYAGASVVMMTIIWLAATLLLGIASTNFMQHRRAVDLYHSLPISRHQLLLANFTATFVTVALPLTANYVITYILAAIRKGFAPAVTTFSLSLSLMDLLGWYITVFAVLAVILLIATQVGSTFDTFLFSGVFLAALPILYAIHYLLCATFLYGYIDSFEGRTFACLSPALLMPGRYLCYEDGWGNVFGGGLAVWLVLGVALLLFALHGYKKRPSERAESTARVGVAALVFRLLAVFVGGILGGMGLYVVLFQNFEMENIILPVLLLLVVVAGALVLLLVEAILGRGFKGLGKKSFLTGGVLIAITLLYVTAIITGGVGFEKKVPAVDSVQSVTINYRGRYEYVEHYRADSIENYKNYSNDGSTEDYYRYDSDSTVTLQSPQAIAAAMQVHTGIIDRHFGQEVASDSSTADPLTGAYTPFEITYQLKSGAVISRQYYVQVTDEVLQGILALEDSTEFREQTNPLAQWTPENNTFDSVTITGSTGVTGADITEEDRVKELLSALRTDLLQETAAEYYAPERTTVAYLYLEGNWTDKWNRIHAEEDFWSSFSVPVSDRYQNTLALLREWGILEQLQTDDWTVAKVSCWGFSEYRSGLIVFPEGSDGGGYASVTLTRAEAEQLLDKVRYTHPSNGGDDSLYLCLGIQATVPEQSLDELYGMPVYISISDALAADLPQLDQLIKEYYGYGWSVENSTGDTVAAETVPADTIAVA